MHPDTTSAHPPPDPADRLVDEMLSFLRGGPLPEPAVGDSPDIHDGPAPAPTEVPVEPGLTCDRGG